MKALAIFSRTDHKKNLYLLPVIVEVTKCPLSDDFDSYDYIGRAWQAMVDVGETDPQRLVPANSTHPQLDFITTFIPGINVNKWAKVDCSLKSRIVDSLVADLYTKESFIGHTKLKLPESVSFTLHRAKNSTDIEVCLSCQSTPLDNIKMLITARDQYISFIRGERYSLAKSASVLTKFVSQVFKVV